MIYFQHNSNSHMFSATIEIEIRDGVGFSISFA